MSAILKFDFQRRKQLRFFWSKLSNLHNKDPIFHMTTTFLPKTMGKKNKQCTHSTALNSENALPEDTF